MHVWWTKVDVSELWVQQKPIEMRRRVDCPMRMVTKLNNVFDYDTGLMIKCTLEFVTEDRVGDGPWALAFISIWFIFVRYLHFHLEINISISGKWFEARFVTVVKYNFKWSDLLEYPKREIGKPMLASVLTSIALWTNGCSLSLIIYSMCKYKMEIRKWNLDLFVLVTPHTSRHPLNILNAPCTNIIIEPLGQPSLRLLFSGTIK